MCDRALSATEHVDTSGKLHPKAARVDSNPLHRLMVDATALGSYSYNLTCVPY